MSKRQGWVPEIGAAALRGSFGEPVLLSYELEYPVVHSLRPAAARINAFCREQAAAFERFCGGAALAEAQRQYAALGTQFQPLCVTASTQILRCGAGLLSGFADGYRQLGASGSFLTRVSRTFSLNDGHAIPLPALFRPYANWRVILYRAFDEEVARRTADEPGSFHKNAAVQMRRRLMPHGYYLADDGLAIWFPQNTVAPGNTGIPTIFIPYERMRGLMNYML